MNCQVSFSVKNKFNKIIGRYKVFYNSYYQNRDFQLKFTYRASSRRTIFEITI